MKYLPSVDYPEDLKRIPVSELPKLCGEIREFIIDNVSKTGGHFAPSLGVVELTVALHYVFEMPKDKIIWDVGHQAYVHKILTGRKNRFGELRKYRGLYGYLKPSESKYDIVHAGHSSTSISIAQGIYEANRINGTEENIVVVIGDGAMTAGMSYEALNNVGFYKSRLIIILNDNGMSISPNIGSITKLFNKLIMSRTTYSLKSRISRGENLFSALINRLLEAIKSFFLPRSPFFDELGIKYIGPVNGHDVVTLVNTLSKLKVSPERPILLHVITKKGKGYKFAEEDPVKYHSVPPFDPKVGVQAKKSNKITYTDVFSKKIVELGEKYKNLVCITPAMREGSGLSEFAKRFPERFFDVAIAEQHGCTFSLGLSIGNVIPVYAIYSTFLQRAYDQVIHDVAIADKRVIFAIDRAGVVGDDGETHQGIFDISFLKQIPNFIIMAPSTSGDLERMLEMAIGFTKPTAIRYPKDTASDDEILNGNTRVEFGKARLIYEGDECFIISVGNMLKYSIEARKELEKVGISTGVVDLTFVKPLDFEMIDYISSKAKVIVSVEDGVRMGGVGESIGNYLLTKGFKGRFFNIGVPDSFPGLGTRDELFRDFGMDAEGIVKKVIELMRT
jgi:1-deoxy-D-xylulose-5-phosphate synthase